MAAAGLPQQVQEKIGAAVAHLFAVGTQWVMICMAVALGMSFLVALAHPGCRVTEPVTDDAPAPASEPA